MVFTSLKILIDYLVIFLFLNFVVVFCNTIFGNAAEFSTKTINQLKKDGCSKALNYAQKVFKKLLI